MCFVTPSRGLVFPFCLFPLCSHPSPSSPTPASRQPRFPLGKESKAVQSAVPHAEDASSSPSSPAARGPAGKEKQRRQRTRLSHSRAGFPPCLPPAHKHKQKHTFPPPSPSQVTLAQPRGQRPPCCVPSQKVENLPPPPSSTSPLPFPPRRKESGPESSTNDGQHQKRGRTSATNGGGYQQREKKSAIRALAIRLSSRAFEARKTTTGADTKQTGKFPSPPHRTALL